MTSRHRISLLVLLLILVASIASAQVFRVGSAAPENSPWGRALNEWASEWQRVSNGRVRMQVFHNAIAGNEADMVRKMRIGQLQAVVMTSTGLTAFSDKVMTLSMPLLIRNEAEYDHVFEQVKDDLDAQVADDGFRVLAWSMAGWCYFFSKDPIFTPQELKAVRLAASPEEMDLVRAYQLMGYQPIPIPYTERLAALANNMANAYLTAPILAAGFQWFGATPNLINLKVCPVPGAIVMSERAYKRLPADLLPELMEVADRIGAQLNQAVVELEQEALDTMVDYGLTIHDLDETQQRVWIDELESSYDVTLGLVFNEEFYNEIQGILDEYRAR